MDHHDDDEEEDEEKRSEALILADIQTLACRVRRREGGWEGRRESGVRYTSESMQ